MALPDDVLAFLEASYAEAQWQKAVLLLDGARLEDGRVPDARLLRCAAFASKGCMDYLERLVALLAVDWRDVIMAGEYELKQMQPVQVRDLSQPFVP